MECKRVILEELSKIWQAYVTMDAWEYSLWTEGVTRLERGGEFTQDMMDVFPHFNYSCLLFGIFASILLADYQLMLAPARESAA